MKNFRANVGWFVLTLAGAFTAANAEVAKTPPFEIYGRLPSIERLAISPDGKMLAYAVTDGEKRKIVIQDIDRKQILAVLNAGDQKIRGILWAGPNHLIISASVTTLIAGIISPRDEWTVAMDYNIRTHRQHPLLSDLKESLDTINGLPEIRIINGKPFAFAQGVTFVNSEGQTTLFKVDLDHDDAATIENQGHPNTNDYVVDANGAALAEAEYAAGKSQWLLKVWKGHWQEVDRRDAPIETPDLLGLGRDGASVLVSFMEKNRSVLRELGADQKTWSDPLPVTDPDGLIWDPASYRLIGESALLGDEGRSTFFDPHDQKVWEAVVAAYPDSRVSLVSFSNDHRKFVILADSPTDGPAYALVDLDTHRGSWIGDEYVGLTAAGVAPVRSIAFKAKDGLQLSGYLTLPRGKDAKNLPLVVFPHGGPASRDSPGFDWWAQAMASRGYAVLQVNYRGSDGLGWDFLSAGFGQWGRKMQTDLSDGVRYLAGSGIIDPARVCIVGASYGGYAALAGATLDAGVYRCAVSVAGPSDLRRFEEWGRNRTGEDGIALQRYWTRYMGAESTLAEISPAEHAGAGSTPILLIHGKDDTVVPYEQSQMMADALRKAGKPVEFVTLVGEDHWLSKGDTRLQMLQAVVAFLEKNNPS